MNKKSEKKFREQLLNLLVWYTNAKDTEPKEYRRQLKLEFNKIFKLIEDRDESIVKRLNGKFPVHIMRDIEEIIKEA